MKFQQIEINQRWKQYNKVLIDFHPRLTIITGANSSGKTTILNLLARHFGWEIQELCTPAKDKNSGIVRYFTHFIKDIKDFFEQGKPSIGKLTYDNGSVAELIIPEIDAPNYNIEIRGIQGVNGLHIPSHRPVFSYRTVSKLSTKKRSKKEAGNLVVASLRERTIGNGRSEPSNFHIKESLITWSIYGYGNEMIESDNEQKNNFREFEDILKKVLPKQLGFERFSIRNGEVVLVTKSGDFMIDAVSGGVSAVIDLAWQIFSCSFDGGFVVLIDEIENHLHPGMQRSILPDFINAFPQVQFVVSTHSPLIVGSVEDSNVYALRFNERNQVESQQLDLINKAKTASEMLKEVLDVPFTMPIWVENKLDLITDKYSKLEINENILTNMRKDLEEIGMNDLMPTAVSELIKKRQ